MDNNVALSMSTTASRSQFIEIKPNLSTEFLRFKTTLVAVSQSNAKCSLSNNTDLYDKLNHDIKRLEKYVIKDDIKSTSKTLKAQFKHASRLQKHAADLQEKVRFGVFRSGKSVDQLQSQADEIANRVFKKTTYVRETDV
ncbi:hypothetical protein ACVBEF_05970 [Glaciimonas sp. GG7]